MQVQLSDERQAQLTDYAQRHGQEPSVALDEVLAAALEWERQDYQQAVQSVRNGYSDVKAGLTRSLARSYEELRVKYGLPS